MVDIAAPVSIEVVRSARSPWTAVITPTVNCGKRVPPMRNNVPSKPRKPSWVSSAVSRTCFNALADSTPRPASCCRPLPDWATKSLSAAAAWAVSAVTTILIGSLIDFLFHVTRKVLESVRRGLPGAGGNGVVEQRHGSLPAGRRLQQAQPLQALRRHQLAVYLAGGDTNPGDNIGECCCALIASPFSIASFSVSGFMFAMAPIISACAFASRSVRRWQ